MLLVCSVNQQVSLTAAATVGMNQNPSPLVSHLTLCRLHIESKLPLQH